MSRAHIEVELRNGKNRSKMQKLILVLGIVWTAAIAADEMKMLYQNDFESAPIGALPDDMLVLAGEFAVRESGTNKFIELPGAPLETFGVLFGPAEPHNVSVSARVFGTNTGRRLPTFAVGLNGVAGYKLQVSPARKLVELFRGDHLQAMVPYQWTPGHWTQLELTLIKIGGVWKVSGVVQQAGDKPEKRASMRFDDEEEPPPGRASVWGSPFSGTPIQFDDVRVWRAEGDDFFAP